MEMLRMADACSERRKRRPLSLRRWKGCGNEGSRFCEGMRFFFSKEKNIFPTYIRFDSMSSWTAVKVSKPPQSYRCYTYSPICSRHITS